MSEEKINLEKIFQKYSFWKDDYSELKELCLNIIKQTLELAAKNARIINDPNSYCGNTGSKYSPSQVVSKQSILNTINQVE